MTNTAPVNPSEVAVLRDTSILTLLNPELADATATENAELIATKQKLEAELQQLKRTTTTGFGAQRAAPTTNGAIPDGVRICFYTSYLQLA